jgi:hypothetical protein
MNRAVFGKVAKAKELAENGVDFSPRHGARCPWCESKCRIYRTMPWDGNVRVRYHRCERSGCVIASLRVSIKSIEVDG